MDALLNFWTTSALALGLTFALVLILQLWRVQTRRVAGLEATLREERKAREALTGEIAAAEGRYDEAVAQLELAVRFEESLVYTEPAEWAYPPRHALGSVLLAADRSAEAETVFWQDLRRNPENGWALSGLLKALRAQKKEAMAETVAERLSRSWARADFDPALVANSKPATSALTAQR